MAARRARPTTPAHDPAAVLGLLCLAFLLAAGCGEHREAAAPGEPPFNPYAGYSSPQYADDALWLCRPGLAEDQCLVHSLDASVWAADGARATERHEAAPHPPVDCFYVYPTVDLTLRPGNHTDFSDITPMLDPLLSQAARFTPYCRVFAPLYRQATIGSYLGNFPEVFDLAYQDVAEAFRHYMGQYNNGRRFVIMGHSQGAGMTTRLLQEEIDMVPALRARLVVAVLLGASVEVPAGAVVGSTFQHLPLCTSESQTGCVIAYRTFAATHPPVGPGANTVTGPGLDVACTNPAALGGGKAALRGAYFPRSVFPPAPPAASTTPPVVNPFVKLPDFYAAECARDAKGISFLAISAPLHPGDPRIDPVPYDTLPFTPAFVGTHVYDFHFALGDLLRLVESQAASRP